VLRNYGDTKRRRFLVSFAPNEDRVVKQAAKIAGLPLAVYVRNMAMERAAEDVERERLLLQLEADATVQANDGQTSIRVVAGEGDVESACDSLGHEADTTAEAEDGGTPSDVTGAKIYVELARQLSGYGLDAIC